jgi:sugar phosphate isomerase/epimerase
MPVRSDSTANEVAAVRTAAADAGVRPSTLLGRTQLDGGLAAGLDDYRKLIDHAADLGAAFLLDLGTAKAEQYDIYFELMRHAAPHAESAGLEITMKPHGGISLTTEHLLAACVKVGHAAFAISYDPGNIIYYTQGERRPETEVAEVAANVSTLIIKDCSVEQGKPDVMVTVGDGLVDFAVVLGELLNGGFAGPSYVECVGGQGVEQVDRDLSFTLGYIRGIYAALGTAG